MGTGYLPMPGSGNDQNPYDASFGWNSGFGFGGGDWFSDPSMSNSGGNYGPYGGTPSPIPTPQSGPGFGNDAGYTRQSPTIYGGKDGANIVSPLDPGLTASLTNWLGSNLGKGATPYDGSTPLPSGGVSAPGSTTAPMNPVLQALERYFQTGQTGGNPALSSLTQMAADGSPTDLMSLPGMTQLAETAKTGNPTDVLPAWEAMKAAQQRNIKEGATNLREQFAFRGSLAGSPFGTAMTDYGTQAAKDENALLAQMSQQASEAAASRKLSAESGLSTLGAASAEAAKSRQGTASEFMTKTQTDLGQIFQGMDQQAIQNALAEFVRTRPEYSPILQMIYGAGLTFPSVASGSYGIGAAGAALSSAGGIASGVADLYKVIKGSGSPAPVATPAPTNTGSGGGVSGDSFGGY